MQERARRSTAAAKNDPYTLIVALDHVGRAEGDLYLDDGSSFAYKRGLYAHRNITFSEGKLTSAPLVGTVQSARFINENVIERIIVLGLGDAAEALSVRDLSTGSVLEAGMGPIVMRSNVPNAAFVVRKPNLPAAMDWSIEFVGPAQTQ